LQLYLGLDADRYPLAIHYPVIRTEIIAGDALQKALSVASQFTHVLFTSKNTVRYWYQHGSVLKQQIAIAIGQVTAHELKIRGIIPLVSTLETQEGIIELFKTLDVKNGYFFYPHSKKARPLLSNYLKNQKIRFLSLDLYDTFFQKLEPIPCLNDVDEIIFTSPSTVEGFLQIFGKIPTSKKLSCIGPVTKKFLESVIRPLA
jgi:uroporphyrinogen-III synthase